MNEISVDVVHHNKAEICEKVLRALPKWFGIESAILDYVTDVQTMPMFVARDGDEVIGFISLNEHNPKTAEIHVMGVLEAYHRQKVGKTLVERAEPHLASRHFDYLTVKTLSESRVNEEYDRTRRFYLAMGFTPLEEFKTLWGEDNPCLFLVKTLPKLNAVSHWRSFIRRVFRSRSH